MFLSKVVFDGPEKKAIKKKENQTQIPYSHFLLFLHPPPHFFRLSYGLLDVDELHNFI